MFYNSDYVNMGTTFRTGGGWELLSTNSIKSLVHDPHSIIDNEETFFHDFASELPEHFFPRHYMHSVMFTMFNLFVNRRVKPTIHVLKNNFSSGTLFILI